MVTVYVRTLSIELTSYNLEVRRKHINEKKKILTKWSLSFILGLDPLG